MATIANRNTRIRQPCGQQQSGEDGAGLLALHGDIQQNGNLLVGDRSVRREGLAQMERVDVVDRHLRRHVCADRPQRKSGGIDHHLTVESGIKRIAGPKMNRVLAYQIIPVIKVAGRRQRRQERMTHERDGRCVEIEVAFASDQSRIIGRREDERLRHLVIGGRELFAFSAERLRLAVERQDICRVLLTEHAGLQAAP